jgi:hypothetical protein
MNTLTRQARAQILHLLCEGRSIRAITRLTGASKKRLQNCWLRLATPAPMPNLGFNGSLVAFIEPLPFGEMIPLAGNGAIAGAMAIAHD